MPLLREYLEELNRLSKVKITWEHAGEEYRRQSIYGLAQQKVTTYLQELSTM